MNIRSWDFELAIQLVHECCVLLLYRDIDVRFIVMSAIKSVQDNASLRLQRKSYGHIVIRLEDAIMFTGQSLDSLLFPVVQVLGGEFLVSVSRSLVNI